MSKKFEKPYWQEKFKLVEKAGGSKLPNTQSLTSSEKRKISFSLYGFIFNFFYYLYLGMWKRAIFLIGIATAVNMSIVVLDLLFPETKVISTLLNISWLTAPLIFGSYAVKDYYSFAIEKNSIEKNSVWIIGLLLIVVSITATSLFVAYEQGELELGDDSATTETNTAWILSESENKLTGAKTLKAEQAYISDDIQSVILTNSLSCVTSGNSQYLVLEIATYQNFDGSLNTTLPMNIKYESEAGAGYLLSLGGLIPEGAPVGEVLGAAVLSIRLNENDTSTPPILESAYGLVRFTNQITFFPFSFEKLINKRVSQMRVSVPTDQGTTSVLIDEGDSTVARIFEACAATRHVPTIANAESTKVQPDSPVSSEEVADPYAEQVEENIPVDQPVNGDDNNRSIQENSSNTANQDLLVIKPSFDCSKASNYTEKLVCSDKALAELDVKLASLYSQRRSESSDKDALRQAQIEWVKSSRKCTDRECVVSAYNSRISSLSN